MSLRQRGQIDVTPTESYTSTAGGSAEMYLSLFFFAFGVYIMIYLLVVLRLIPRGGL